MCMSAASSQLEQLFTPFVLHGFSNQSVPADEAYADYAEVSESDSLSLARGLGLEPVSKPSPEPYVTGIGAPACHQNHQTAPVRLLLADGQEVQVSTTFQLLLSCRCTAWLSSTPLPSQLFS